MLNLHPGYMYCSNWKLPLMVSIFVAYYESRHEFVIFKMAGLAVAVAGKLVKDVDF